MSGIDVEAIARRLGRRVDLLTGWLSGLLTAMSIGFSVLALLMGNYVAAALAGLMALACVGLCAARLREIEKP